MKKVLSIVLSIAMVLCMMPAMAFAGTTSAQAEAAYSDTAGTACEGAVNVLSALGVVDGYTDGTYKPEQTVTRAEMAKLIVTALGVDKYATATTSKFTDMGAASWAIPYVEYASNLNIVNGYGYGKFGPNDTVTYEQAVTMIVRALGYTDECKEMNGSWPAIYVQKATALGIFTDVVNGGAAGADRGDVAIMLYNALDLPEVYADGDGATQYKNGSEQFTINGTAIQGVSMLSTLNKDGQASYGIMTSSQADDAVQNLRGYVGAAAKVFTNKNDDVIAVGDVKSEFVKGKINADHDTITVDGKKYSVEASSFSKLDSVTGSISKEAASVPYILNGANSGVITFAELDKNNEYIFAVKKSGSTITSIFSVQYWSKTREFQAEDTDLTTLSKDLKLKTYELMKNNDGEVDYSAVIVEGVESVDQIAEDDIVTIYADRNDKIRKVSVSNEIIEGTLNAYTPSTDAQAYGQFTIDTTKYAGSLKGIKDAANMMDITGDDSDAVSLGDDVKAYLNYAGKIFKLEKVSGNSDYVLVLETADESNSGLNKLSAKVKVMTADGEVVTVEAKDAFRTTYSATLSGHTWDGAIARYAVDSSSKIKSIDIDAAADNVSSTTSTDKVDYTNFIAATTLSTSKTLIYDKDGDGTFDSGDDLEWYRKALTVSKNGYVDGNAIADDAVIFVVDKTKNENGCIDEDDVKISSKDAILDSDINVFGYAVKNGKITAMVLDGASVNKNIVYGVITSVTKNDTTEKGTTDYTVTMLVDGEEATYNTDYNAAALGKSNVYKLTFNAEGNVTNFVPANSYGAASILGYTVSEDGVISTSNNQVASYRNNDSKSATKISLDSGALYLKWNGDKGIYEVKDKAEFQKMKAGKYAILVDTDFDATDSKKADKVADLILFGLSAADVVANTAVSSTSNLVAPADSPSTPTITAGDEIHVSGTTVDYYYADSEPSIKDLRLAVEAAINDTVTTVTGTSPTYTMIADGISYTVNVAQITVNSKTFTVAGYVAPVKDNTAVTTVTAATEYTGTVAWTPALGSGGKFAASTEYKATIKLTAKDGYVFDSEQTKSTITVTNGTVESISLSADAKTLIIVMDTEAETAA